MKNLSTARRRRILLTTAASALLLPTLGACSSSTTNVTTPTTAAATTTGSTPGTAGGSIPAAKASGEITLYSGRSENLIKPLVEQFTQATGIKVNAKYADSADIANTMVQEGDNSPADVFLSQSAGATGFAVSKDSLQELDKSVLNLVPADRRDEDGHWVGVTGRARVLVYNTTKVQASELPKSVLDLTKPEYKDRVAVAPANGSFQDFITAVGAEKGAETAKSFLTGLKANGARPFANNGAIVTAVGQGEIDFGLVNHYYLVKAKAENPGIAAANHFFADGDLGSMLNVSSAGIPKGARNKAAAEEFVKFLLSEKGQTYFASKEKEYPLVTGIKGPEGLPALDSLKLTTVDIDKLGAGLQDTIKMIKESKLAD